MVFFLPLQVDSVQSTMSSYYHCKLLGQAEYSGLSPLPYADQPIMGIRIILSSHAIENLVFSLAFKSVAVIVRDWGYWAFQSRPSHILLVMTIKGNHTVKQRTLQTAIMFTRK